MNIIIELRCHEKYNQDNHAPALISKYKMTSRSKNKNTITYLAKNDQMFYFLILFR